MIRGVLKDHYKIKGFGFINGNNGENYFVHISSLREYLEGKELTGGQKVSFDIDRDTKVDRAINVRID